MQSITDPIDLVNTLEELDAVEEAMITRVREAAASKRLQLQNWESDLANQQMMSEAELQQLSEEEALAKAISMSMAEQQEQQQDEEKEKEEEEDDVLSSDAMADSLLADLSRVASLEEQFPVVLHTGDGEMEIFVAAEDNVMEAIARELNLKGAPLLPWQHGRRAVRVTTVRHNEQWLQG